MREKFSVRLQMALNTKNIKPFELAKDTGISKSLISHYLSGKYKPGDENLEKISKYIKNNTNNLESQYYDALFKLGVTDKDGNIDQEKLKRNIKIIEFYNNNFDDK